MKPRIAITMGDPAGIGPELCLRILQNALVAERCVPIIFGDAGVLACVADKLNLQIPNRIVPFGMWSGIFDGIHGPTIVDLREIVAESITPGAVTSLTGLASYQYVDKAINAAIAGQVDAITTGPIHKEAWHSAGISFPGHTEIFAAKTKASRFCMMLTSHQITCSLVTAHVGYADAAGQLTKQRVLDTIELSHEAIERMRDRTPRILVCGLNPHAGEHGLFGNSEEEAIIRPAVEAAQENGICVQGPLSPDTAFVAQRRVETDCYVCMYHDQGLIPLKTLAFDEAVNVTLGLPIIRTSVDHGTALDIAWTGKADPTSMIQAIELAAHLVFSQVGASATST